MKMLALVPLLAVAACATQPAPTPMIQIQKVPVAVPVRCTPQVSKPAFTDSDAALKAAPDGVERYRLLAINRPLRMAYEGELEAALKGCEG